MSASAGLKKWKKTRKTKANEKMRLYFSGFSACWLNNKHFGQGEVGPHALHSPYLPDIFTFGKI
jgi:hypothetical protein